MEREEFHASAGKLDRVVGQLPYDFPPSVWLLSPKSFGPVVDPEIFLRQWQCGEAIGSCGARALCSGSSRVDKTWSSHPCHPCLIKPLDGFTSPTIIASNPKLGYQISQNVPSFYGVLGAGGDSGDEGELWRCMRAELAVICNPWYLAIQRTRWRCSMTLKTRPKQAAGSQSLPASETDASYPDAFLAPTKG